TCSQSSRAVSPKHSYRTCRSRYCRCRYPSLPMTFVSIGTSATTTILRFAGFGERLSISSTPDRIFSLLKLISGVRSSTYLWPKSYTSPVFDTCIRGLHHSRPHSLAQKNRGLRRRQTNGGRHARRFRL